MRAQHSAHYGLPETVVVWAQRYFSRVRRDPRPPIRGAKRTGAAAWLGAAWPGGGVEEERGMAVVRMGGLSIGCDVGAC